MRNFKKFLILINLLIFYKIPVIADNKNTNIAIHKIVVFGDSLSDNGNYLNASKDTSNPMPLKPYFAGRASNGKIWLEYIALENNFIMVNYAYLGALTSGKNPKYPEAISLINQIDKFEQDNKKSDLNNTLFFIWAGANNIFKMNIKEPIDTFNSLYGLTEDILVSLEKLKKIGAKNIFIANIPDLGNIALTTEIDSFKKMKWILSNISRFENYMLMKKVTNFSEENKDINLIYFDSNEFLNRVRQNPGRYFIANIKNACYVGVPSKPAIPNESCNNSKEYLFWDLVHPTTKVHCFAAIEVEKVLKEKYQLNSNNNLTDKFCSELN
ncbi:SGNH/GDSL hydrolase family protein [Pigmentibacter sp. JX0631]|uniref:SGNH/GDSL hydrolase family protein n=1 Tax=Pigmentibacter sp. JX0631 TaxID=2976982 RepID=UPI0024698B93|nr:SGNH/GDSL hydrolase family protein [Pigmentibacter sp. JX0631]WGL60550.1 SGNH/GDSL hydrolase family protein [Pigmentibacter sp. JX0631]